jgi:TolA-binding protein
LIENIETITIQDSLLALSNLDRDVLDRRINKIVDELKEKKRLAAEEEAIRRDMEMLNNNSISSIPTQNNTGGVWYFYNTSAVARGTNDFNRLWGRRPYGDFWRYINKSSMSSVLNGNNKSIENEEPDSDINTYNSSQDEEQSKALENVSSDLKKYYEKIPFSQTAQLVAKKKIQTAYLDIGKVYFEDLKEDQKAKNNFSSLIEKYPQTEFKPEALFYLTKIAFNMGDTLKANQLAIQISEEFPETIFNQVLNNKEIPEDNSEIEVLKIYQEMYLALQYEDYDKILQLKNLIDKNHAGNSIQDKIDYVYAQAIGKTKGRDAYISELESMKETYQGSSIGELSSYTLRLLQKSEEKSTNIKLFDDDFDGVMYYVITGITAAEKQVEIKINEFNNRTLGSIPLKVSNLILGSRSLFYIKQFSVKSMAIKYHDEIKANKQFLLDAGLSNIRHYPITEKNFRKLISNKKEIEYMEQFKTTFFQ